MSNTVSSYYNKHPSTNNQTDLLTNVIETPSWQFGVMDIKEKKNKVSGGFAQQWILQKNMEITCPQKLFVTFFKACCLKYSRLTKSFQEKHSTCKSPSASRGFSSYPAGFLIPSLQPWNNFLTRILARL